ncbi:MAG: HAMP domain-containing protein, partial [Desulfurivibrionaceae bacterium]
MKLHVTYRVFGAILAANAIIVLSMFLIMQWSMDRGFLKYVNHLEQTRLDRLATKLGQAYSAEGDWDILRTTPETLTRLISETVAEDSTQYPPSPVANYPNRQLRQPGSSPNRRYYRLERRIVVLDAKRSPIFGADNSGDIEVFKPISDRGQVVGYLGLRPSKFLSNVHQLKFVAEQKFIFALIAVVMLLVAAAISLPLARRLVRPLRKLAAASSQLSSGHYDIRVPVESEDEFGRLSRNFNALALSLDNNEHARRQFVADISHELRTPLAILGGEIEAIKDGVQDLSYESIDSLQVEVFRLNRLVEDLYQLALSDVGALAYRKADVNLTEILAEAINRARPKLAEKKLALQVNLPQDPVPTYADDDRLSQLFDNLLENSQKYTDPGGGLDIALQSANGAATINFKDSGPGVTEKDRGKIGR